MKDFLSEIYLIALVCSLNFGVGVASFPFCGEFYGHWFLFFPKLLHGNLIKLKNSLNSLSM